jgi:hypothetical protein
VQDAARRRAHDFQRCLAEVRLQVPAKVAEELLQGRRVRVERGEDQASEARHPGGGEQAVPLPVEVARVDGAELGNAAQLALVREGPAVIAAPEVRRVAQVGAAQLRAAVRAGVQEDAYPALLVADHDHRLVGHAAGDVIAGLLDLALVGNEKPGFPEDLREFFFEYVRRPEGAPADHVGGPLFR